MNILFYLFWHYLLRPLAERLNKRDADYAELTTEQRIQLDILEMGEPR